MCVWGGESVRTCARKSNAWLLNSSAKNGNKISPSEDIGCSRFHQNKRISARVRFLIPLFCLIFVKVRIARKKNYQVRLLRSFGQGWWSSRLLQTLLLRVRSPCLWDKIIRDLWYFTIASTTTIASISPTFTSTTTTTLSPINTIFNLSPFITIASATITATLAALLASISLKWKIHSWSLWGTLRKKH